MTAHPKIDPVAGEMIFYGSAAKGRPRPTSPSPSRHHTDTMLSDMVVFDTADPSAGPIAVARLPFHVLPGTHGT